MPVNNEEVINISRRLEQIQHRLRRRKPIPRIERRPSVDVVDGAVERVGGPERRVQPVARHAVRSEQHVPGVPED